MICMCPRPDPTRIGECRRCRLLVVDEDMPRRLTAAGFPGAAAKAQRILEQRSPRPAPKSSDPVATTAEPEPTAVPVCEHCGTPRPPGDAASNATARSVATAVTT